MQLVIGDLLRQSALKFPKRLAITGEEVNFTYEELNLRVIPVLRQQYGVPVGYSGHETGIPSSVAAVAIGACVLERHITLERAMWGSDQAASLGPSGLVRLVRDVRLVETSMGDGVKRVLPREVPVMQKLRRVGLRDRY